MSAVDPTLISQSPSEKMRPASLVALSKVSLAGRNVGSFVENFARREANFMVSIMSRWLFEEQPSVPKQ